MNPEKLIFGIDLGTRNTCMGVYQNNRFNIIPDKYGNNLMPSVVAFHGYHKIIGKDAIIMDHINPRNTVHDIKRIIGRKPGDSAISMLKRIINYDIVEEDNRLYVQLDNSDEKLRKERYSPEEITSFILSELRNRIISQYNILDIDVVITVPTYYNDSQRLATMDAAKIAGLNVIKVINEPTAAALAYGMGEKYRNTAGNIIVYDLGAGTLDIVLLTVFNGVFSTMNISGNMNLGGEDIDLEIMNYIYQYFKNKHRIVGEYQITALAKYKLKMNVETAKKILSTNERAIITVENFYNDINLYFELTKTLFEEICNKIFLLCISPLDKIFIDTNITRADIDEVILVGGSTRIPKIQELILQYFKGTKLSQLTFVDPDEIVANGAAFYGYVMTNNDIPEINNITLLDVLPLSLGVEMFDGRMSIIAPKNTTIPFTDLVKKYTPEGDYVNRVLIKVYEGERKLCKNNFHLGSFEFSGFTPAPRGHVTIYIKFGVDLNGILHVRATEKKSGIEKNIDISGMRGAKNRLSTEEIDKLIREAKEYETQDNLYSMKILKLSHIKHTCKNILLNIKSDKFNVSPQNKSIICADIDNILTWLSTITLETITLSELDEKIKKLENVYTPYIICSNINKPTTTVGTLNENGDTYTKIHGDDEPDDILFKFDTTLNNIDINKKDIDDIKQNIADMCNNLIMICNNPDSVISSEDVTLLTDYLETVLIWIYTVENVSVDIFVIKIDEVNKTTKEVLDKYNTFFVQNNNFTIKDELYLLCKTIHDSITNNILGDKNNPDIIKLYNLITETGNWLLSNNSTDDPQYTTKINIINTICNSIYEKNNIVQPITDINPDDIISNPVPIVEDIDSIINNIDNDPILMKIDVSRLIK